MPQSMRFRMFSQTCQMIPILGGPTSSHRLPDCHRSTAPCQVTGAQYPAPCCRAALTRKTSPTGWDSWQLEGDFSEEADQPIEKTQKTHKRCEEPVTPGPWRTWPQGTTAGALRPLQSAVPPDRNTAETLAETPSYDAILGKNEWIG